MASTKLTWQDAQSQIESRIEERNRRKAEALEVEQFTEYNEGSRREHLRELASQPELWGVCIGFFVLGCLHVFSRLPVNFFLKDELSWSPPQMEFWHGLTSLPWVGKALYGLFSDAVPIFGSRRRSYLIIFGLGGTAVWISMAFAVRTTPQAIAALVLQAWTEAFILVVLDAVLVERSHARPQAFVAFMQSFCWGAQAAGKIAGAGLTGVFVDRLGTHWTFFLVSGLPLGVALASFLIREAQPAALAGHAAAPAAKEGAEVEGAAPPAPLSLGALLQDRIRILARALILPSVYLPCIFLIAWQAAPSVKSALFFFSVNVLHYTEDFYALIFLLEGCAELLGVLVYSLFLSRVGLRTLIFYAGLAGVAVGSSQLVLISGINRSFGIPNQAFSIATTVAGALIARITALPLAVLTARVCPKGIEATLYGLFTSLRVGSWAIGQLLGSALMTLFGVTSTNFAALPLLVVASVATSVLPLPLVWLLPSTKQLDSKAAAERARERQPLRHACETPRGGAGPSLGWGSRRGSV